MFDRLLQLDRRWVFAAIAIAVGVPVITGLKFPEKPSDMTRKVFEAVESTPPGSRVMVAMDYDPAAKGELQPMAAALTRHAALKGHRLFYLTTWPAGPAFLDDMEYLLKTEFPAMEYGRDYVNLGFRAGEIGAIKIVSNDLRGAFATDVYQHRLDDLPIAAGVKNVRQMDLLMLVSGGTPGAKEWIQLASSPYRIKSVAGTTGVQTGEVLPYYPEQLTGVLGGVKAAAEYELLLTDAYPELEQPGRPLAPPGLTSGRTRMGPQLVAHLLMIALIVVGNVIYFTARRKGGAR